MIFSIETSCDETSAAVVSDGCVLSNVVSSQIGIHAEYGGVVPELAAREHLKNLMPVSRKAFAEAGIEPCDVNLVAATRGPGLPNALMVGFMAGQTAAFALGVPFMGIHHHEAHLYSAWIKGSPPRLDFARIRPSVCLIVSGGHTLLVHVSGEMKHRVLGSTVDDAAGECFDKVAKLIGLPYPGGPELDKLARDGNPERFRFPRPMLNDDSDDFSFSGLKTSVRYFIRDNQEVLDDGRALRDLCAGVQAAIVDVLVGKTVRAARKLGVDCISASGGVVSNSALRRELTESCRRKGIELHLSEGAFCTDNAGMIGILAGRKCGVDPRPTPTDAEILPGWELSEV